MNGKVEFVHRLSTALDFWVSQGGLNLFNNIPCPHRVEIRDWNLFELHHRAKLRDVLFVLFRKPVVMHELNGERRVGPMVGDLNQKGLEGILSAGSDVR